MVQGSPCPWKNVAGCFEGRQPAAHAISIVNYIVVKTRIASRELRPPFFLELRDPLPWLWQAAPDGFRQ